MFTNESRPDFKVGTLPIPHKYRDRVKKLSSFSEWTIYSAQPLVTPVPVFYDGIEHRYSWDDLYLVPMVDGKETDDFITVTVAAVDPDLSQPPRDEEDRIRRASPASFFSDSPKHEAWHRMVREQGLDGLFIVDKEGYAEAVINASSLNQYDLFRSAYLWLTTIVRSTNIFASYANWTPSDLEDKVLTQLKSADSVLHHECMRYLARHPEAIPQIHPRKFESLVASILRHLGYNVQLTPASWGGGNNLIVLSKDAFGPILTLVDCKRYSEGHKVSVQQIREILKATVHKNATRGVIVTTSSFTNKARRVGAEHSARLALIDGQELTQWLVDAADWQLGKHPGLLRDRLK